MCRKYLGSLSEARTTIEESVREYDNPSIFCRHGSLRGTSLLKEHFGCQLSLSPPEGKLNGTYIVWLLPPQLVSEVTDME